MTSQSDKANVGSRFSVLSEVHERLRTMKDLQRQSAWPHIEGVDRALRMVWDMIAACQPADSETFRSASALNEIAQGPCETTLTPRFAIKDCSCGTYEGNLGPCLTWNEGNAVGRCVFCDHGLDCHVKLSRLLAPPTSACKDFTKRERAMLRRAIGLLLSDEIQGEKPGDREAAESAQAKL